MADRTWEDVAAGVERRCLHDAQNRPFIFHIAAALREAHEAGLRESGKLYAEHSRALDRLLEQAEELAALRRELAARRAVDRWTSQSLGDRFVLVFEGVIFAIERTAPLGLCEVVASDTSYPALAAALGLEVGDE
jgi:hypothetical protein